MSLDEDPGCFQRSDPDPGPLHNIREPDENGTKMPCLDVSLMDDTAWSAYTLGLVETLCEDGAVAASATWDTDMLGNKIPPKVVKVTS